MKTVTTAEIREKFQNVLYFFVTPKRIIMDVNTSFKNETFPKYLEEWKIEHHYVTTDVHRENG